MSPPSFPRTFPCSGAPFPPRGPSGWFPRFFGTVKHSDFLPPLPRCFVSFAARYRRCTLGFAPADTRRSIRGPGIFHRTPETGLLDGDDRTSQVPGGPSVNVPCSPTPAGPPRSATTALRCCLPPIGQRRLPRQMLISGLNHTARTLAVYASQGGLLHRHARLASGGWPTLPGGTGYPSGPNERFQVIPSSFPRLCLAHPFQSIEITGLRAGVLLRTEPGNPHPHGLPIRRAKRLAPHRQASDTYPPILEPGVPIFNQLCFWVNPWWFFRSEPLLVIPSESSVSETTRDQREAICLKRLRKNESLSRWSRCAFR
jgi:hypothetical protein